MPLVGQKAPEWSRAASVNGDEKVIRSLDLEGRWYVLCWDPQDFTFVCPTEINGLQRLLEDFEDDGVVVIGASTDTFRTHAAWFDDRETFPHGVIHPVLADPDHTVSRAFGVIKEDEGVAYLATVVVDDRGMVRSTAVNDLSVGRSPHEVLRTVQALLSGGLCGADWTRGRPSSAASSARGAGPTGRRPPDPAPRVAAPRARTRAPTLGHPRRERRIISQPSQPRVARPRNRPDL